ncbi:S8 family peptidase [Salinactinospora qingdaonensis]|uniref:Type VII secretion-associated serine protease mycosin n=1 Tax=Salinactinospora qingdaonensis TaxID=702744 RepID=A0ABP7G8Z8_9ACTN
MARHATRLMTANMVRARGACAAALMAGALTLGIGVDSAAADPEASGDLRYQQWGLEAVDAPKAWEITEGWGVTVALLDTGVDDSHPDLAGNIEIGPDYTGEDARPGEAGYGGHGTKMAGIIAANGHGVEHSGGVMGVAPNAEILSIRVGADPGSSSEASQAGPEEQQRWLANGIREAVREGAQIVSIPLLGHGGETSAVEREAVEYANRRGVVIIAGGSGEETPFYPAAYENVLAASPVGPSMRPSGTTSTFVGASLPAPAEKIATTATGGGYEHVSGTDAAAAMVTGVAALVRSEYPQLRPDQVKDALVASKEPQQASSPDTAPLELTASGTVNASYALEAAGKLAADQPAFDPELAQQNEDEGLTGAGWTLWAGIGFAGVLLVAAVIGGRTLQRRMANPYNLPDQGSAEEPLNHRAR